MKNLTLALAAALALGACATQDTPKPAPAPAPSPAAKPAPAPTPQAQVQVEPAKPVAKPAPARKPAVVNLSSTELFEFNKATLTKEARGKLDSEVIARLRDMGEIRSIRVNGHADRLGSEQYNQRLSERRADAVRAYLVSKGASASKVATTGFGKTKPEKSCDQKDRKALIECLSPNRRVVVEIEGSGR